MTEDELYELNQLPEIDPDYVPKRAEPAQNEPARITTKKAWFLSLFFPVLSLLASSGWIILEIVYLLAYGSPSYSYKFFYCTALFGLIVGGIVPTVLIARNRLDTSKYFLGKLLILLPVAAITVIFVFTRGVDGFMMLGIMPELIYASVQKTNIKTKICLFLSSLAWGILGFLLDFWLAFTFF